MSNSTTHNGEKKREKVNPSPATSSFSDGGKQRWQRWWVSCSSAGVCVGEGEREGSRESPGFYTSRERGEGEAEGGKWPAALPLMVGGQPGAKDQETGKTARNGGGFDCGELLP
jgi:hypothetical protein